ncbi:6-phospho-3-hexuloisomerase [Planococcus lenghuensis]|uniref:6-phospho 3-hexuloisomerase n=1 Tax=Planococcus lenghuensis TaxID=2213202 RepID=A0A1Q2KV15_9BACL|nr:6-phospho-3-hexuloisomerase [Planococcus lenghuensis]AQQ52029.1 6-phospho 3-hexuloisomerase [Planococcus lenghuensis]
MQTIAYTNEILSELTRTLKQVDEQETEQLTEAVWNAGKVFVAGGGRSGFMAKAFVMRLMHIGLNPYVVGETVTPNLEPGDLFIIGSGSGETKSLVMMTEKAKDIGATIAAVTTNPGSSIGQLADIHVNVPAQAKGENTSGKSVQPMGSLFEQALLLIYDAVVMRLMEKKETSSGTMYGRHANLE